MTIRRPTTLLATMLPTIGMLAVPAAAHDDTPRHGHMLIQRPTIEFLTVSDDGVAWDGPYLTSVRRCIDMPVTPLRGHHDNVHQGRGGAGLANAGHAFAPIAPLGGIADCAAFENTLADGPLPAEPPPEGD